MFLTKSNLKDYIGILYYRHGLFCASHPISCLMLVFSVVFICCYPLKNLTTLGNSLEQYRQSISTFDGLEANTDVNFQHHNERLPDRPAWYNRVPVAYMQRIVVKSVIKIPSEDQDQEESAKKKKSKEKKNKLYLIDTIRTPIQHLFELNEFIRNFRTSSNDSVSKSLISDMCVHVGELKLNNQAATDERNQQFNKHYLPEFNCLYLSPANFWSNDVNLFKMDSDILHTIENVSASNHQAESLDNFNVFSPNHKQRTNLRELLFGVSWPSLLTLLDDDSQLMSKLNLNEQKKQNSIVFSYAITLALKQFDKQFLHEFKTKLNEKFNVDNKHSIGQFDQQDKLGDDSPDTEQQEDELIVNLQYTSPNFIFYIPYLMLYVLLFLYIYISVRKIEFVKSKWGLALAAVSQVIASLFMSIGICSFFGLTPTLNGGEVFPYLVIFIGFENIVVLTKSVVSTPFDLDVRYRIALGLKKESWLITKILTFELIIIFFGILTMVPAIQEFCVFAYVGLLIDFFMQMIFFVTVLSIDIRRMELSDLNKQRFINSNKTHNHANKINEKNEELTNSCASNINGVNHKFASSSTSTSQSHSSSPTELLSNETDKNKSPRNYFMNKSMNFFYFWAKTRMVQRVIMFLSALWIILIFYKSLLVVELMRHDVNVKKETVEALLPKGIGFPMLIKENYNPFASNNINNNNAESSYANNVPTTTIDYFKRSYQNFVIMSKMNVDRHKTRIAHKYEQNWQTLSYFHWLSLFANYNISLYNRYVAILPQINLVKLITQESVLKCRNQDELLKYSPISELESEYKLNEPPKSYNITSLFNENEYKSAVFELVGIVVLGIPTIFLLVYFSIFLYFLVFYKFLCSTKYIEWRKSWSTSHIKRQYEIIHSNSSKKTLNDSSENEQSDTSDYEDCVELSTTNGKQSRRDANEQIKQIINEQNDEMNIETMFAFNTNITNGVGEHQNTPLIKHNYPIDLIACGASVCVTSDLNNQLIVWPISATTSTTTTTTANNRNYSKLIDLNSLNNKANSNGDEPVAVWCMQVTMDDQYLLVGQSNGVLRAFDLTNSTTTTCVVSYEPDEKPLDMTGLTHLIQLKLNDNSMQKCALLTRNTSHSNANCYLLLGARLDGHLELFKLDCATCRSTSQSENVSRGEFSLVSRLRAHKSPITNILTSNEYILSTSQENVLRISKVNAKSLLNNAQFELNSLFTRDEHDNSPITAMCVDMDNAMHAATGSMNGTICLWNLFTGECKFKLRKKCTRRNSICKLLLTQNVLVSLNDEQEMCIWNGLDGNLVREFKFHAPLGATYRSVDGIERSSHQLTLLGLLSKLFKSMRHIFANNNDDLISSNDELLSVQQAPSTTMCLYSKNVLITGGCSCIYLWNIFKGKLVKKLNIKSNSVDAATFCSFDSNAKKLSLSRLTHKNIVKRINVIPQPNQQTSKNSPIVMVTDHSDAIYILQIPSNIIKN